MLFFNREVVLLFLYELKFSQDAAEGSQVHS